MTQCIHELPDGDTTSSIWISPEDTRNSDATYSRLFLSLVQLFYKFQGKEKEHLEVLVCMGFSFNEPNEFTTYPFSTELEILILFDGFETIIVLIITV